VSGSVVERWVRHLRASPRWKPLPAGSLRHLDIVLPTLAVDATEWPVIVAPFRLDEQGLKDLAGDTRDVLFVQRSHGALSSCRLQLDDVQLHVSNMGLAILHVAFLAKQPEGVLPVGRLLDVAESFRRMESRDRESATSAFILPAGTVPLQLLDEVEAQVLGDASLSKQKLHRWLPELPGGCVGLVATDFAWSLLDWALRGSGALAPPSFAIPAVDRDPIHDYFVRTYLRVGRAETPWWSDGDEGDLLRRFALGEAGGYAGGTVGTDEQSIVKLFRNLDENAWGVSCEGTVCLVRTDEHDGFFDHQLPGRLKSAYLVAMHLALLSRSFLLGESMRLKELARERLRAFSGQRGRVLDIRESVMQFNLQMNHHVVSTNPRHQALYDCHRRAYQVDELHAEVKEEVGELDEWLERVSRQTVQAFLTALSLVALPLNIAYNYFGQQFPGVAPVGRPSEPRFLLALGVIAGAIAALMGLWTVGSSWLASRRVRSSLHRH